jgi:hypothetical protein
MILCDHCAFVVKNHGGTECTEMHRVEFMIYSMILCDLCAFVVKTTEARGDAQSLIYDYSVILCALSASVVKKSRRHGMHRDAQS